jgi:hypothetical protein
MSTVTTSPNPVIQDSSATLFYTNPNLLLLPGSVYVLKNILGNNVSSTYTAPVLTRNNIAPNVGNYTSISSSCFYSPNGEIYTSMETSPVANNGFIQITSNGVSSVYLQFDLNANPPIPGPNPYGVIQYPTGVTMDSSGYLYFLVFGNNDVYKINNIDDPTDPTNNLSVYNINPSVVSAPFELTITPNNYLYITSTNPPYYIEQIDTSDISGNTTAIQNYTANRPSYGITSDINSNLYIGYAGGVIGKYNTITNTFTDNFITITGEGTILGLVYISLKNIIVVNTASTNIYVINLLNNSYSKIINNSGILGGLGTNKVNSLYGTTTTGMVQYTFDTSLLFNNLYLTTTGVNVLNVYNVSTSTILDTISVNVTTPNATGYYYGGIQTGTDLINIFQPISLGIQYPTTTGYKTNISGNIQDFNQIFASLTSPSAVPLGYNVGWQVNTQDLSQIFAKYNPIVYQISNQQNLTSSVISNNGYTGIIFENNTTPSSSPIYGTCNITFLASKTIVFLVIGGGGGGGAGYSPYPCAGAGAGGGSFVYQTTSITANSQFSVQVGFAGLGRQATNPGYGGSTGNTGGNSFITTTGINFTANGGAGGKGVGTAQGYAGGVGGSSVNSLNNTGGGGGGSGGGASQSPPGAASNSGLPGYLNTFYNGGMQGGTANSSIGGSGGNCYNSSVSLPFTSTASTVYFGNGGGGGANSTGGKAGFIIGGAGNNSPLGSKGENAVYGLNSGNYYYGNGGGGGAQSGTNWGGSGGNGVVMVWWQN